MAEHVFKQLDMSNTYAGRHAGHAGDVSSGFKIGFLKARAYKAPEYRGTRLPDILSRTQRMYPNGFDFS